MPTIAARPAQALAVAACLVVSAAFIPAATAQQTGDYTVADVDGATIFLSDLEAQYRVLPQEYRQMPMEMLFSPLLERAIENHLVAAEAENAGLEDNAVVQKALAFARAEVLRDAYFNKLVTEGVTDDVLQALYDERAKEPGFSYEEVSARHILLEQEDEAKAVIVELDGGADFAELAKEKSTGPSAERGGDLGYFTAGQMVPAFSDAAFAMEIGSHSAEPVQSDFGWHVIKVEDKRTATPSLDEMRQELTGQASQKLVEERVAQLRAAATIKRFDLDGNELPEPEAPPAE